MRYRDLFEAVNLGSTFYHVTTDSRLKSIMTVGLEPNHHRRWKNLFGAALGDRGYIYLISNFAQAVRFAARQNYLYQVNKKNTKTVILALQNVPTEGLEPDPNIEGQFAGNTWFRAKATIPPQDIVRVIPLTQEMVQQVIADGTTEPPAEESVPEPTR